MIDCNGCYAMIMLGSNFWGFPITWCTTDIHDFWWTEPTVVSGVVHTDYANKKRYRYKSEMDVSTSNNTAQDGSCPDAPDGGQCPQNNGCSGSVDLQFSAHTQVQVQTWTVDDDGRKTYGPWVDAGSGSGGWSDWTSKKTVTAPSTCNTTGTSIGVSITLNPPPVYAGFLPAKTVYFYAKVLCTECVPENDGDGGEDS